MYLKANTGNQGCEWQEMCCQRACVLGASQTRQMCVGLFLFRFQFSAIPAPLAQLPQLSGPTSSPAWAASQLGLARFPKPTRLGEEGGQKTEAKMRLLGACSLFL